MSLQPRGGISEGPVAPRPRSPSGAWALPDQPSACGLALFECTRLFAIASSLALAETETDRCGRTFLQNSTKVLRQSNKQLCTPNCPATTTALAAFGSKTALGPH